VSDRLRARGASAKPAIDKQPGLLEALDELVEPTTRGTPMSGLRWSAKSTYQLALRSSCLGGTPRQRVGASPMAVRRQLADAGVMKTLTHARHLADQTPASRNRYVDFLRAASILVVVFGHWLMAAPEYVGGELRIGHLIADVEWVQGLTWVLQVMPIFFFVGGYANAVAWRAARRDGVAYPSWLRDRLRRLVLPVLPVLAVWAPAAYLAWRGGIDPDLIRIGSQAALVPTWFLATYVLIVVAAPLSLALWERHGWRAFAVMVAAAALVDVASIGAGVDALAWASYLFVWNAVHLLGYAWADGRIGRVGARVATALGGLSALTVLVAAGPYPLAMVGVDGVAVTNSNPPRVTLVALGVFQFGLVMALEGPMRLWLARRRPWTAVVAINGSIMSLYLWHLTVLVAVLGVSIAFGGVGLHLAANSGIWWLTRPLWLGLLVVFTLPVLALVARFERPARDPRPAPPAWRPVAAAAAVCAGLGTLAKLGIADEAGLNLAPLLMVATGVVVGSVIGPRRTAGDPTT